MTSELTNAELLAQALHILTTSCRFAEIIDGSDAEQVSDFLAGMQTGLPVAGAAVIAIAERLDCSAEVERIAMDMLHTARVRQGLGGTA